MDPFTRKPNAFFLVRDYPLNRQTGPRSRMHGQNE